MMKEYRILVLIIIVLLLGVLGLSFYIVYDNLNDDLSNNKVYLAGDGVYYYNPVEDMKCEKGTDNCYGFYILTYNDNQNEESIELIMNKNIGGTVAYNENGEFEEPVTAIKYLGSLTNDWKVNEDGNIGVQKIPEWLYTNGDEVVTCNSEGICGAGGYWISDSYFLIDASRGLISAGDTFLKSDPKNASTWGVRPVIRVDKKVLS